MSAKTLTIVWERIGTYRNVPDFVADFDDENHDEVDELCRKIDAAIRPNLGSRFFSWSMDLEGGPLSIEAGRFGNGVGTVTERDPA